MEEHYKNRNFIIAEVLACLSFALNTICVFKATEPGAWMPPLWSPDFGNLYISLVYWLKTILAIIGLSNLFTSKALTSKGEVPHYMSISTSITLWYSIPIVNYLFLIPLAAFYSIFDIGGAYEARIPFQIFWSIPAFLIAIDLLKRLFRRITATRHSSI